MKSLLFSKFALIVTSTAVIFAGQFCKAECRPQYNEYIHRMQANEGTFAKGGAVAGLMSGVGLVEVLSAVRPGVSVFAAAMVVGAVAGGRGGVRYAWHRADEAQWVNQLILESRENGGTTLAEAASRTNLDTAYLKDLIVSLDNANAFCQNGQVLLKDDALNLISPLPQGD